MQFTLDSIITNTRTKKRKRSPNWELSEKALLKDCVKDYIRDIGNKAVDTNTNKKKQIAWQFVYKRFNKLNMRIRSLVKIKQQWKHIRLEANNCFSDNKKLCTLNDSGAKPLSLDPNIQDIIKDTDMTSNSDAMLSQIQNIATEQSNGINTLRQNLSPKMIENINYDNKIDEMESTFSNVHFNKRLWRNKLYVKELSIQGLSDRNTVLIQCIKAESDLRIQQMTEAHKWAHKEHLLTLQNLELENKILLNKLKKQ